MDVPTSAEIDELLASRDVPCVSLFMPAHRRGPETQQDRLRLRNLIGQAEERLLSLGLRGPEANGLLAPARDLLDDGAFWRHQGDGLAAYLAPGWSRTLRVPFALRELVVVSGRCHVRPLFDGLWPDQRFHVLALSLGGVHLFEGSRYSLQPREVPDAPRGIEDTQRFLDLKEQLHAKAGPRRDASRTAVSHSHGAGREVEGERIIEYAREVDRAVTDTLGQSRLPLVLAGVEHVLAAYRAVTSHGQVMDGAVDGSFGDLSEDGLHAAAWALVEPVALRRRAEDLARYAQAEGKGMVVNDLEDVLVAALQARIEALFVARDELRWGRFAPETAEIRLHHSAKPGDEDLLDRAVVETYRTGGSIHTLPLDEMPGSRAVAALTRF